MRKRVLVIARLSKKIKGEKQTGIDTQDLIVPAWVESQGWEVVAVVADFASGRLAPWKRKNLKPWVTDSGRLARYDAVAGLVFDRLSRGNDAETAEIEKWARDNGKELLTVDGLVYPCEGVEGIRWDVTKRIAYQEWLNTSQRTRRGLSYLRENDFATVRPPFGFLPIEVDKHSRFVPDPALVPCIKAMRERIMGGDSLMAVCRWLSSQGIWSPAWQAWNRDDPAERGGEPGKHWDARSLGRYLRNPILSGRQVTAEGKTLHRVPAIFTDAEHKALVARLDGHPNRRGPVKSEPAFLRDIIFCPKCLGIMHARHSRNKRIRADGTRFVYHAYRCDGSSTVPSQCRNMVPMSTVDEWINAQMSANVSFVIEVNVITGNSHEEEIITVKRDISELDVEDEKYDRRLAELRAELARLRDLPSTPDRITEDVMPFTVGDLWGTLDVAGRRRYLLERDIRVYASRDSITIEGDPAVMRVAA